MSRLSTPGPERAGRRRRRCAPTGAPLDAGEESVASVTRQAVHATDTVVRTMGPRETRRQVMHRVQVLRQGLAASPTHRPVGGKMRRTLAVLGLGALVLAGGCSDPADGFGIPVQPAAGTWGGERELLTGSIVTRENGCFFLDLGDDDVRWIIWPAGTQTDTHGRPEVAGHGVRGGDPVSGQGVLADATTLSGWSDDQSQFGSFGRFCSAEDSGIVVLDSIENAD